METIMFKHKQENRGVILTDFISTTNILTLHNINNKKQLFTNISNICEKNINISNSKFLALLLDKEMNENSGIGEGVAIPNIQISEIKKIVGVFIKLNKSINFNSIDNEPVDLIFTLISPKNNQPNHLYILAFLSRLFKDKKKLKNLRASLDKETIYAILTNKL